MAAHRLFWYFMVTLLSIGTLPLFLFDKVTFFLIVKQWHHPIADRIAPYFTWIGDGITYCYFILIIALRRTSCRKIIIVGGSFVGMSIIVQLLKRVFFIHMVRPILLIPINIKLHLVQGVELCTDLSFPSGHSATIFTLVSVVQLVFRNLNKLYSFMLLLLALAVAYSRIYLCQHFYTDVYVGALIGTVSALTVYGTLRDCKQPYWLNFSAYAFIQRYGARFWPKK